MGSPDILSPLPVDLVGALRSWGRIRRQADAELLAVLRQVEDSGVAHASGYPSVSAMLCAVSAASRSAANKLVKEAAALRALPVAGAALAAGDISTEHLEMIDSFRQSPPDSDRQIQMRQGLSGFMPPSHIDPDRTLRRSLVHQALHCGAL